MLEEIVVAFATSIVVLHEGGQFGYSILYSSRSTSSGNSGINTTIKREMGTLQVGNHPETINQ
jgi:hypothetical protein